ncbi:MAG: arginine--tRNA ligase, partial [Candidatus Hydrogenedens sp.]
MLDIVNKVKSNLVNNFGEITDKDILISSPPDIKMGDVSIPLFALSKKLNIPLPELAEKCMPLVHIEPFVDKVERVGGYLNLFLNRDITAGKIIKEVLLNTKQFGSSFSGKGKKALIEHTSINPNASPHVGRARNAMIGDSLSRIFRFEGYDTEVHYYVNDMGRQIGLLVLISDEIENLDFNGILQAYVRANQRAENDPEFAQKGYDLLAKMEEGDEDVRRKFFHVTDMCLKGQLQVLKRLDINYDYFDRESNFIESEELNKVL